MSKEEYQERARVTLEIIHQYLASVRFHGHLTPVRNGRHTKWVCVPGEISKVRWDLRDSR